MNEYINYSPPPGMQVPLRKASSIDQTRFFQQDKNRTCKFAVERIHHPHVYESVAMSVPMEVYSKN